MKLVSAIALFAVAAAANPRSLPHSEPRNHARAQRRTPKYAEGGPTQPAAGVSHSPLYCVTCDRDFRGRIRRSPAARRAFQQRNPCPTNGKTAGSCRGYVVDHVVPLKRGGADVPENMQWQNIVESKLKDRTE